MPDPTPEEKALFGFEDTTQPVGWLRTQEITVAVSGLDAVHRNLVRAAVAAEAQRLRKVFLSIAEHHKLPAEAVLLFDAAVRTLPATDPADVEIIRPSIDFSLIPDGLEGQ